MYVKHFIKMLLGLVVMGAIGITGLVIANHYSKKPAAATPASSTPVKK